MNFIKIYYILLTCLLISGSTWSQEYGGYASVSVKSSDGEQRTINVNTYCNSSTKASAETSLLNMLNSDKKYNEEFSSKVIYTIILCKENDKMEFGGSASVTVQDTDGLKRVINVNAYCNSNTYTACTQSLLNLAKSEKEYNEVFMNSVKYDVTECSDKDVKEYGGTASVTVIDYDGGNRFLNVTAYCNSSTIAASKQQLLNLLNSDRKYNERFCSEVEYRISSCNK